MRGRDSKLSFLIGLLDTMWAKVHIAGKLFQWLITYTMRATWYADKCPNNYPVLASDVRAKRQSGKETTGQIARGQLLPHPSASASA